MMKRLTFIFAIAAVIALGGVLGTTVFEDTARSAGPAVAAAPVLEQNVDSNGFIKVHEQGTSRVNVTNATVPVQVQGTSAIRSANDEFALTDTIADANHNDCGKDIYTIPNNKQLVIEFVSSTARGMGVPHAEIVRISGESSFDASLPFVFQLQGNGYATASEAVHYVVSGGKTLTFFGESNTGDCDFVVSLGGYLQPW